LIAGSDDLDKPPDLAEFPVGRRDQTLHDASVRDTGTAVSC
jgi:hypothetical protein